MTLPNKKRPLRQHYISGLGDGNVRKRNNKPKDADDFLFRRPVFDGGYVRRRDPIVAKEPPPAFILQDLDSTSTTSTLLDGWQVSAMALLCVMGLLLALFLQLMSDGNHGGNTSGNPGNTKSSSDGSLKQKKSSVYRRTEKKKTDEWSEDERITTTCEKTTDSSSLYYPYQPRYHQQQQHRHRKISGSGHAEMCMSGSAASPVIINSRPFFHHNVSGNSKAATSSKSPAGGARGTILVGGGGVGHGLEGFQKSQQEAASTTPPPPRLSIRAQPLSPVSSFCSLGEDMDHENHNNNTPDEAIPRSVKTRSSNNVMDSSLPQEHDFMFSSEHDFVTPKAGPRRRLALPREDEIETAVPFSGTMQQQEPQPAALPFIPDLGARQNVAAGVMRASSPSSPFSPRNLHHDDTTIMRMESGDMLSPPIINEKESSSRGNNKPQAYPGHASPFRKNSDNAALVKAAAAAASPGPRNSIIHKRKNLTLSTDAGSSLQSCIDFDELQLNQVIGGGGFGQVWKATWRGTPVAVKVLTASAQTDLKHVLLEEFAAEINMLKGMRHPHVCLYMGACLDPPNRAIVTELAANGSLWDALRLPLQPPHVPCDGVDQRAWLGACGVPPLGTWPWALVKRVACGAARGMTYLHSGNPPVLHRDLKSANLLLDDAYTTKVCDFGLSRIKAHQSSMTGNCGTVQWMAPEVLANQHYAEPADVYSFGIILWELLTRECPYDGMSAIQCALAVLNRNHRPPIPEWCPPALEALIVACVEKDPSKRPTFAQIILALDAMP